jgi:hypothetical protein
VETGAREPTTCRKYVSKLFLVAKPGKNQWRFLVYVRHMNTFRVRKRLHMESPLGIRPKGRVLRDGNRSIATRLPKCKRARSTLSGSSPTNGLIAKPLPFLRFYRHIRATPTPTRARWVDDTPRQAYAPQQQHAEQALPRTRVGEEQRSYLTSTTTSSSWPPSNSRRLSVRESTFPLPVSDCSAAPPMVCGN